MFIIKTDIDNRSGIDNDKRITIEDQTPNF